MHDARFLSVEEPLCFVSWSGEWGRRISDAVKTWLDHDLFASAPEGGVAWNSQDITPGSSWVRQLERKLKRCKAAIICVTPEALESPWVNYEVGALSHAMRSQASDRSDQEWLFPLLFGVNPSELGGPLATVQSISADEQGHLRRLAGLLRERLSRPGLSPSVHDPWERFQWHQKGVPPLELAEAFPGFSELFRRKAFQESVGQCVNQRWLERYDSIRDTLGRLHAHERVIARCCRPYLAESFRRLITELDRYAMAVSMLIGAGPFALSEGGALEVPEGFAAACEDARKAVRRLVAQLLDRHGPVFDEAFSFQVADSAGELANLISHRKLEVEALAGVESLKWLDSAPDCVTFDWMRRKASSLCGTDPACANSAVIDPWRPSALERWRKSPWPFDRILFSVLLARRVELAVTKHLPLDEETAARIWQQLCVEIKDPCSVCGIFGHGRPSRMAVEYALMPLALLATFERGGHWQTPTAVEALSTVLPRAKALFAAADVDETGPAREVALERLATIELAVRDRAPQSYPRGVGDERAAVLLPPVSSSG